MTEVRGIVIHRASCPAPASPTWLLPACLLLLLACQVPLASQDLDRIAQKDFLRLGGSLGTSQVAYLHEGIAARRLPYTYVYQGSLNIDFLGITSTLSFLYTNPQFSKNISNPFNTFAYHPRYKGLSLHIGRISCAYSPYTLNGHLFEGGGFDYAPKKIPLTIAASFGRFQRALAADSAYLADTSTQHASITPGLGPSFLRWGGGFKLVWSPKAFKLGLIGFRAQDDAASLPTLPSAARLKPQENSVVGISLSRQVYKHLSLSGELALSALNSNKLAEYSASSSQARAFRLLGMQAREGAGLYKAYKIGLAYTGTTFSLGVGHERVDPNYKTLGSYFFNNDLESTTIDFSSQLFRQSLSLSGNFGIQRDDLDRNKATQMRRLVGSLSLGLVASQRLSMQASYSNFRSYSNTRALSQTLTASPSTFIDTLAYRQISQNGSLGYQYLLASGQRLKQQLSGNATYQGSADLLGERAGPQSHFYNLSLGYGLQLLPLGLGLNLSGNGSRNDFDKNASTYMGPSLTLTKAFLKNKLRSNASATYVVSQGGSRSEVLTCRAGLAYTLKQVHQLSLQAVMLDSDTRASRRTSFREYTLTANYSYTFKLWEKGLRRDASKSNTETEPQNIEPKR